ncbi:Gfo/Idh/MocA family protein [Candidatus Spongiihabitans sp.]|uniref:Gfo/Idh/MocA family protein n=1 Tax=Candidatus Spongiihabitans sp. TaxID=3101308 RepID=UPI003C7BF34A
MKEIGVGVIGTAFMGKAHSLAYAIAGTAFGDGLRPRLEVLCDINAQRGQAKRQEMGFARSTTQYMDVINDPKVELISICVPNVVHKEIAVAALRAGKHVWCEKPMATNVAEAEEMLAAARASDRQTILGYNYTQNPLVHAARQLIEEGAIGRVIGFHGIYDVDNEADPDRPHSWRMNREASGCGANADLMCHLVSMAHFMTGSEVARLVGDYDTVHQQRSDPKNQGRTLAVDNDDVCTALAHFASGIKGTLRVSRVAWGRKCGLRWEIHGSQGMICHDQERLNEIKLYARNEDPRQQGFRTILSGPCHQPYDAFLPNAGHALGFIDVKACELHKLLTAITTGEPAWPSFEDGIKIERVMDAIDRSVLSGQWLDV